MAYQEASYLGPGAMILAFHNWITGLPLDEDWQVVWGTAPTGDDTQETQVVYRGKGSTGTDTIYVGLHVKFDELIDRYYLAWYAMLDVVPEAVVMTDHVNVLIHPAVNSIPGPAFTIDSEFYASGRRLMGRFEFGSYTQDFYAGLLIPTALPTQYPYPYWVSGNFRNGSTISSTSLTPTDYTEPAPEDNSSFVTMTEGFAGGFLNNDGIWIHGSSWTTIGDLDNDPAIAIWPWASGAITSNYYHRYGTNLHLDLAFDANVDGGFDADLAHLEERALFVDSDAGPLLEAAYLLHMSSTTQWGVIGAMEGVRAILGNQIPGSVITDNNLVEYNVHACENFGSIVFALEKN